MKRYSVKYSKKAEGELVDIWRYIAVVLENPIGADKTIEKILRKNEHLKVFPSGTSVWGRVLGVELRALRTENYISFYSVDESKAEVIIRSVIYARRDIRKVLL